MDVLHLTASISRELGVAGIIDIAFMSMILYVVFIWFKKRRAFFVLAGIGIIGAIYLVAHQFKLVLTSFVLQSFFAVILVAILIIFQEELKYFFEQIAVWSLNRKFHVKGNYSPPKAVDALVSTLGDLAHERIGALIVLKGKAPIERHADGGFDLNGEISVPLLKSIFDPHSVGHDGAVVVEGDRVVRFGCQLPLSRKFSRSGQIGMRHAAAVGLSELGDALCLVVSEETGKISVALNGQLTALGEAAEIGPLRSILIKFYTELQPPRRRHFFRDLLFKNYREKILAILITLGLWYMVVHETGIVHETFILPIEYTTPSSDLYVDSVDPKEIRVTFSGPRHAFQLLEANDMRAVLKLYHYGEGTWSVTLSEANITTPVDTVLEDIDPSMVLVEIEKK